MLNSTTFEERLNKNWKWCKIYFDRKIKEFQINGWSISMDNKKTSLGTTDYNKKRVTISKHFLRGITCNEKKMRNTILHEIAHVLTPGHQHGKKWKSVALKIGCDGKICGEMDLPDPKYIVTCKNKCFTNSYYRKPKVENKICPKCRNNAILKIMK